LTSYDLLLVQSYRQRKTYVQESFLSRGRVLLKLPRGAALFTELRSAGKLMKTMTIIKIDYPRNALGGVQGREITHPQL
jgi:hypothetical protein